MIKVRGRMKMKKILPVKSPIDFIAYKPFDASRIAILLAQETLCKELYENFIHFRIEKLCEKGMIELDCHFNEEFSSVGVKKVPIDVLFDLHIEFIDFCKKSIDREFYLFIPIETSEISNYSVYKEKKVPHHIFVYGYDDEKQVFKCSEFFSFSSAQYSFEEVSYQEMKNAFLDLQQQTNEKMMENEWAQWLKDIQLLHCFKEYKDRFTIERVRIALQNYLDEKDCYGNKGYIKDVYYGFAIYDLTEEYIDQISKKDRDSFDIRCFSLILFHFHYLRLQAEFIKQNYEDTKKGMQTFIDEFNKIEKDSKELRSLAIKYRLTHEKGILNRIKIKLQKTKEKEMEILVKYINYLKYIEKEAG